MENFKNITLDNWIKTGEGGNADTYDNIKNDNILLKLAKNNLQGFNSMKEEFECIDKAMLLNINTPKMIEKIICDERIGIIYEKIHNKKSLGRLCHDNPSKIKYYASILAKETANLHSKKCNIDGMRNYKQYYIDIFKDGRQDKFLTKKIIELIENETTDSTTCLHGDITVGNLICSNDKWYWIDLGRMGYGDPIFDLIDTYFCLNKLSSFGFVTKLFHMNKNQLLEFWDEYINQYAIETNQDVNILLKKIKRLSIIFFFKIWVTGVYIPILYTIIQYNIRKYYKKEVMMS